MLNKIFRDNTIPIGNKINLVVELHSNPDCQDFMIEQALTKQKIKTVSDEAGFYGNVWIRKLYFETIGALHDGHSHKHDHLSLLVRGSVTVEVEGFEAQIYRAPTFITIKAERHHKITALEDDSLWFCIFAVRDNDSLSADEYFSDSNNPLSKPLMFT